MSNTCKEESRQDQEATLEVIKDTPWKWGGVIAVEVVPEDGFSKDNKALAADLEALWNAQKVPPGAQGDISHSDNVGGQEELIYAQLCVIESEEESEEDKEK